MTDVTHKSDLDKIREQKGKIVVKGAQENNLKNIELYNQLVGGENSHTTKTVDSLIYDHCEKIDLIKIDTEGYEYEILSSINMQSIESFRKTIILVEVDNSSSLKIFKLLKHHDCYSIDKSSIMNEDKIIQNIKKHGRGMDNLLFIPKDLNI